MNELFSGFPMGSDLKQQIKAMFHRVFGCSHRNFDDLGDEDTTYPYCWDCMRFIKIK